MFKFIKNLKGKKEDQEVKEYEPSETFLIVQENCKKIDESIKRMDKRNEEISQLNEQLKVTNDWIIDEIRSIKLELAGEVG